MVGVARWIIISYLVISTTCIHGQRADKRRTAEGVPGEPTRGPEGCRNYQASTLTLYKTTQI